MSSLLCTSIATGILSGILVFLTFFFDVPSWVAFLGATSYFAFADKGRSVLLQVWATNFTGVMWAWLIAEFSHHFGFGALSYLITGLVAFLMCYQAKLRLLKFIPGTFIGAAALFSSHTEWYLTYSILVVGAFFGFLMFHGGEIMAFRINHKGLDIEKPTS